MALLFLTMPRPPVSCASWSYLERGYPGTEPPTTPNLSGFSALSAHKNAEKTLNQLGDFA